MSFFDPQVVGAWCAAAIFAGQATFERYRATRKSNKVEVDTKSLSDAKMFEERGNLMARMYEETKVLFEKERAAHQITREYWHEKSNKFQADISRCQEQILELKGRPDLSDVLRGIQQILEYLKNHHEPKEEE